MSTISAETHLVKVGRHSHAFLLLGAAEGVAWVRLNDSITIPVGATAISILLPGVCLTHLIPSQSVDQSVSQLCVHIE